MKNVKCPVRTTCVDYGNCTDCSIGNKFTKLHKRIDRLKKQNEKLIIERNAWFLTAKAMKNEWIPVEERLPDPKEYDWVLVNVQADEDGSYYVPRTAEHRNGEWWEYGTDWKLSDMHLTVTHWMPLPEYPKEV